MPHNSRRSFFKTFAALFGLAAISPAVLAQKPKPIRYGYDRIWVHAPDRCFSAQDGIRSLTVSIKQFNWSDEEHRWIIASSHEDKICHLV